MSQQYHYGNLPHTNDGVFLGLKSILHSVHSVIFCKQKERAMPTAELNERLILALTFGAWARLLLHKANDTICKQQQKKQINNLFSHKSTYTIKISTLT